MNKKRLEEDNSDGKLSREQREQQIIKLKKNMINRHF